MCENCNELLSCPIGEKRRKELGASPEPTVFTNGYGQELHEMPWRMVVERPIGAEPWAMLYQGCNDQNGMNYGAAIIITHCPFCGEILIPAMPNPRRRNPMKNINWLAMLVYTTSAAISIAVIVWLVNLIF